LILFSFVIFASFLFSWGGSSPLAVLIDMDHGFTLCPLSQCPAHCGSRTRTAVAASASPSMGAYLAGGKPRANKEGFEHDTDCDSGSIFYITKSACPGFGVLLIAKIRNKIISLFTTMYVFVLSLNTENGSQYRAPFPQRVVADAACFCIIDRHTSLLSVLISFSRASILLMS
jgi:hypothetical protein